jgi:hypothetical protein
MKLHLLLPFFIALMPPGVSNILADDASRLVMTPLPPGPILPQLPDMCAWQILFSYSNGPTGTSNAGKPTPETEGLPRMVTITQTKPLWHSIIVTMDGKRIECWGTPEVCYLISGAGEKPTVLRKNPVEMVPVPSAKLGPNGRPVSMTMKSVGGDFEAGVDSKYLFNPAQGNFPDMEWLSPQTYVGLQQEAFIFRQQGTGGAEVRIRADTRFPVSWTKGNEVRTFQLLPTPQEALVFPPDVASVAAEFARVEALINAPPPLRTIPPLAQPSTSSTSDQ